MSTTDNSSGIDLADDVVREQFDLVEVQRRQAG